MNCLEYNGELHLYIQQALLEELGTAYPNIYSKCIITFARGAAHRNIKIKQRYSNILPNKLATHKLATHKLATSE